MKFILILTFLWHSYGISTEQVRDMPSENSCKLIGLSLVTKHRAEVADDYYIPEVRFDCIPQPPFE